MLNVNNIQPLPNGYHKNRLSLLVIISTLKKEAVCSTENFCATTLCYSPKGNTRKMYTDCRKDLKSSNEWLAYLPFRTVLVPLDSYQILLQITSVFALYRLQHSLASYERWRNNLNVPHTLKLPVMKPHLNSTQTILSSQQTSHETRLFNLASCSYFLYHEQCLLPFLLCARHNQDSLAPCANMPSSGLMDAILIETCALILAWGLLCISVGVNCWYMYQCKIYFRHRRWSQLVTHNDTSFIKIQVWLRFISCVVWGPFVRCGPVL